MFKDMKKLYVLAAVVLGAVNLQAQTWITVDFEDQTLASESFYNGADSAGGFTSGNVFFNNVYSGYHASGYAYSNVTDNTTAGYTNAYSAFPGTGADGSEIFAIHTGSDTIVFPNAVSLDQVSITNTTYAGISMRDGDQFAKVFGDTVDANGNNDGTNGEDFFFLRMKAWDVSGNLVDSIDVYLADFRFADTLDDYILDTWLDVDLSSFVDVKSITSKLYSSDIGSFGMNTPNYYAMDNLIYSNSTSYIAENSNEMNVYPNPFQNTVTVKGIVGTYAVVSMNGAVVANGTVFGQETINLERLNSGVYFLQVSNDTGVTTQKIIKQ